MADRRKWFVDKIGKRVWRTKSSCKCEHCKKVYEKGLKIHDDLHADYLYCIENEIGLKYFSSEKERNKFENSNNKTIL